MMSSRVCFELTRALKETEKGSKRLGDHLKSGHV
jgi:hypothetical protein